MHSYNPTIPLLGIYPKELKARTQSMLTLSHRVHSTRSPQPKVGNNTHPLMDEPINNIWYICTMKYYSVIQRNEILIPATTWINLENTALSEISQTQKDKYCVILLWDISWINKFIETEGRREVIRDWGNERMEDYFCKKSCSFALLHHLLKRPSLPPVL